MFSDLSRSLRPIAARNASRDSCSAQLRQAAIQAVAEQGFAGLTVDGLCARANITPTEFSRNWSDPGEVLRAAIDEQLRPLQEPDLGSLPDDLAAFVGWYLTHCSDPAFLTCIFYVLTHARLDEQLGRKLLADFIDRRADHSILIERAVARGDLPADTDPDPILDEVLRLGLSWMGSDNTPSPEALKDAIQDLLAREAFRRDPFPQPQ
jgi:AcrR family transcriptional regulator